MNSLEKNLGGISQDICRGISKEDSRRTFVRFSKTIYETMQGDISGGNFESIDEAILGNFQIKIIKKKMDFLEDIPEAFFGEISQRILG